MAQHAGNNPARSSTRAVRVARRLALDLVLKPLLRVSLAVVSTGPQVAIECYEQTK